MKEYLKMSDVFAGIVSNHDGVLLDDNGFVADTYGMGKEELITHAINSHDELVQMNQELLAALEAVIEWYDMAADHSIELDFYKRMAACKVSEDMAREAISKAKVGEA